MIIALVSLSLIILAQTFWIWKLRRSQNPEVDEILDADNPELLAKTRRQLYREISRHESTGELLRETQQYLQSIINSMPSVLIGINAKGEITHRNLAASAASKLSDEKAIGSHINIVYPDWPINDALISETIKIRQVYRRENIQIGRGSNATFIDLTLYPLIGDNITGAVIQVADVSKQVRVESMLIQSDKMMSLGEMAAGLAHEINNPLASILNNAQNIERRTSPELPKNRALAEEMGLDLELMRNYLEEREVISFVKRIRSSGEQAAQIVKNMLEFSRSNYQTHKPHDISELIDDALELTRKNLELHTSLGIEMPKVEIILGDNLSLLPCSATEIKQVLVNLIRNAAQAFQSDEYGPPLDPYVQIEVTQIDTTMVIEIRDNGPGMVEEIKRHIFEPFFTTKDIGKGTGLGLSVSYFIVTEHHHGTIEVDSKPGEGTIFTIKLPTSSEHHEAESSQRTQALMT